jgi:hypothetical protein
MAHLIRQHIKNARMTWLAYKIRDVFWIESPRSGVWGKSYFDADPAVIDEIQIHPRELSRQGILRSLTVLSSGERNTRSATGRIAV